MPLYPHSHFTFQEQPLWISPERADKIRPPAFQSHIANNTGHISDCTNLDFGNCFMSNPLASSLLRSFYYSGVCCKYLVDISRCGGVCAVSFTHGGSKASNERLPPIALTLAMLTLTQVLPCSYSLCHDVQVNGECWLLWRKPLPVALSIVSVMRSKEGQNMQT